MNRTLRLVVRKPGPVDDSHFALAEEAEPRPTREGDVLVRVTWLSIDPTQRGWMARDTYMKAVAIGEVMRSFAVGRVVESRHAAFAPGDVVAGLLGWQDLAVVPGDGLSPIPPGVPIPMAMSVLGITGLTAWFGLLEIGRPVAGETVLVSAAAGATGSVVGQIARIKGCRAVGIAGGPEKCRWVKEVARFDAALDYREPDLRARLRDACPKGVDVYFDNVGGETLEAALDRLALHARVVLCGAISGYETKESSPAPPRNYMNLLVRRARMEGFLVSDFLPRAAEAQRDLAAWVAAGQLGYEVDVVDGLERAPFALGRLFRGENRGKQLVHVAD